jgi:hypothetical protein
MMLTHKNSTERSFVGHAPLRNAPLAEFARETLVLDDSTAATWVDAFDAAWLGSRWTELETLLERYVTLTSSDFSRSIVGRDAALRHLRVQRARTQIHEHAVADLRGYTSGRIGIITYRWQRDWTVDRERRSGAGRDILVLQPSSKGWRLSWRGQTVRQRPGSLGLATWPSDWEQTT